MKYIYIYIYIYIYSSRYMDSIQRLWIVFKVVDHSRLNLIALLRGCQVKLFLSWNICSVDVPISHATGNRNIRLKNIQSNYIILKYCMNASFEKLADKVKEELDTYIVN